MYEEITAQARTVITELLEQAHLKPNAIKIMTLGNKTDK